MASDRVRFMRITGLSSIGPRWDYETERRRFYEELVDQHRRLPSIGVVWTPMVVDPRDDDCAGHVYLAVVETRKADNS